MAMVVVLLLCHLLKEGIEEVVVLSAEWSPAMGGRTTVEW